MEVSYGDYPPKLSKEREKFILTLTNDFAIANGLAVRPVPAASDDKQIPYAANTAPVTLFPSLFPKHCFEQARGACLAYNELYSAIASDEAWLKNVIEELIAVDDFIDGLWKIHLQVKEEGYAQTLQLGLFRSDYMVHMETGKLDLQSSVKQVEFNTIASSFGGLSTLVYYLHQHLVHAYAYPQPVHGYIQSNDVMPDHDSIAGLAKGLASAHNLYKQVTESPRCLIFVVQEGERNVFDQRHVEFNLRMVWGTRVYRVEWNRVLERTTVNEQRALIYHPPHDPEQSFEVSTVYFRAGYAPTEYETPDAWKARLHIERSRAIKCPSVLLQLAGTKKVQQVLATPGSPHLAKFLPDPAAAKTVESTFAPIYPMDNSTAGKEARSIALDPVEARGYVLKPQREGGGNNIYREAIPDFLRSIPESSWPAYILMEMIEPPPQRNIIVRNSVLAEGNVICELGVYGTCLWDETAGVGKGARKIIESADAGYLLRTKAADSSEGGVAAGFGSVDSALLLDFEPPEPSYY